MEIVTKQYLENNLIAYDNYRGLGKIGQANGIATLDANGKLSNSQIPVLPQTQLAVADTNNATSNAAVSSGTVYINTYDVKGGSSSNTGAISITGSDGINVTSNGTGDIQIKGHEKPANLGNIAGEGFLVPEPTATDTTKYLKADGTWDKPTDTQVTYRANNVDNVITSLASGTGINFGFSNGRLTINGPASSRATKAGTGLTEDDSKNTTERYLNLKAATASELGGVKVGTLGTGDTSATVGTTSQTIYAPPASGKYYPIETVASGDHSGHAVVKIPDVPSPFYDNTNDDISVDTSSLQELMFFYKQPLRSEANGSGGFNWVENGDGSYIVASSMPTDSPNPTKAGETGYRYDDAGTEKYIFPIINLPSSVIFAELQIVSVGFGVSLPVSIPLSKNDNERNVIDTTKYASMQFTGFDPESIKAGNPAYAYLRFTTDAHTYNATVEIWYNRKTKSYSADIIV